MKARMTGSLMSLMSPMSKSDRTSSKKRRQSNEVNGSSRDHDQTDDHLLLKPLAVTMNHEIEVNVEKQTIKKDLTSIEEVTPSDSNLDASMSKKAAVAELNEPTLAKRRRKSDILDMSKRREEKAAEFAAFVKLKTPPPSPYEKQSLASDISSSRLNYLVSVNESNVRYKKKSSSGNVGLVPSSQLINYECAYVDSQGLKAKISGKKKNKRLLSTSLPSVHDPSPKARRGSHYGQQATADISKEVLKQLKILHRKQKEHQDTDDDGTADYSDDENRKMSMRLFIRRGTQFASRILPAAALKGAESSKNVRASNLKLTKPGKLVRQWCFIVVLDV